MGIKFVFYTLLLSFALYGCATKSSFDSDPIGYKKSVSLQLDYVLKQCAAGPGAGASLNDSAALITFTIAPSGYLKDELTYQSKNTVFGVWVDCLKSSLKKVWFNYPPNKQDYLFQAPVNWDAVTETNSQIAQQRAKIKEGIKSHTTDFRRCYNSYLTRGKNIGTVTLHFMVLTTGKVANVHATSKDFQDEYFLVCLESVISIIDFTESGTGPIDTVTFPMGFGH